jgi:hypothetical protein
MFVSINDSGFIIGFGYGVTSDSLTAPEGFTPENKREWCYQDGEWVRDLAALIREKQDEVKTWAAAQIKATDWRKSRAEERAVLNRPDVETPANVYAEREAIRVASNRVEAEVALLGSQQAIEAFTWQVEAADYP